MVQACWRALQPALAQVPIVTAACSDEATAAAARSAGRAATAKVGLGLNAPVAACAGAPAARSAALAMARRARNPVAAWRTCSCGLSPPLDQSQMPRSAAATSTTPPHTRITTAVVGTFTVAVASTARR